MRLKPDYHQILDSLTAQLLGEMGGKIHAVILFGSVARQEPKRDSDIDVLIVADLDFEFKQAVHRIAYEVDLANEVFTQIVFLTPEAFEIEADFKSYFIQDILEQGMTLYDDGIFQRIREEESQPFSRIP